MSDNREIERLKGKIGQLEGDLRVARQKLREAVIAAAPFQPGQTARFQGTEVIVRRIEPKYGAVWYSVSKRKKNGDWSRAELLTFGLDEETP